MRMNVVGTECSVCTPANTARGGAKMGIDYALVPSCVLLSGHNGITRQPFSWCREGVVPSRGRGGE